MKKKSCIIETMSFGSDGALTRFFMHYALTEVMPLSLLINLLRRLISQEPGR